MLLTYASGFSGKSTKKEKGSTEIFTKIQSEFFIVHFQTVDALLKS